MSSEAGGMLQRWGGGKVAMALLIGVVLSCGGVALSAAQPAFADPPPPAQYGPPAVGSTGATGPTGPTGPVYTPPAPPKGEINPFTGKMKPLVRVPHVVARLIAGANAIATYPYRWGG